MTFVEKYGKILRPLITPYKENEDVDYDRYAELIEYVVTRDLCDSLIVTGTTGEASLLTFDERVKLMETAVKAAAGRKPVIAGTGCASTKETVMLTKKAEELGIELCLIVCPFYNKPTQEGLYLHYKAIAESVKVDIMLYNIPIFVGVNLEAETVGRLAAIPRDWFPEDPTFSATRCGRSLKLLKRETTRRRRSCLSRCTVSANRPGRTAGFCRTPF